MRRLTLPIVLTFPFLVLGCGGSGNSSTGSGGTVTLNASPASADVDYGGSFTLSAYATVTGYTLSSNLGFTLQGPGNIAVTGPSLFGDYSVLYTASASPTLSSGTSPAAASATITIASKADNTKTLAVPITLHNAIQFADQTLPNAFAGKAYTYTFSASGGTGTLSFQVVSRSAPLPAGLTLSTTGTLSGIPTATGTYSFEVVVYDQATYVVGVAQTVSLQIN